MTTLERRMDVLYSLREEYQETLLAPYLSDFMRDIDRRIDQLKRVRNAGSLPPIEPRSFEGHSDDY